MKTTFSISLSKAIDKHFVPTPKREVPYTGRIKSILKQHPIMVQKHVNFMDTSSHNQPGIHNKESPEQDLTIPDLRNVLITHTMTLNGISDTALIDSRAQEDFVDTKFVLAYNMATTTTSLKRFAFWRMVRDRMQVQHFGMLGWS
jgi:hypothetical protein